MGIYYTSGYKYQLKEDYNVQLPESPRVYIDHPFFSLTINGLLGLKAGYAWDGPSGPVIQTSTFMRASLVHDALYQFMREGYVTQDFRPKADLILKQFCLEDGMSSLRAWYVYQAVKLLGTPFAKPKNKKEILHAP